MDIYDELGVTKIINCAGTYTVIGGSRMSKTTLEAMNSAASAHIQLKEMQKSVYSRIAEMTKNEAAVVTAGAMAGIYLTIASCISLKKKKPLRYISKKEIQESEVIVFRSHRNPYDRGLEILGVNVVEIGYPNNIDMITREGFEYAFTDKTVAVLYLPSCDGGWVAPGALTFEDSLEISNANNIPLIVDAAAQLPPKSNLWTFTKKGASAIIFSGGKDIKGPQTTGLVLGKSNLLKWLDLNNFPNYGIGRMQKVGREELAGIYQALKEYMDVDESKREIACEEIVKLFVDGFDNNDQFYFERSWPNEAGQPIARAKFLLNNENIKVENIVESLLNSKPSIFTAIENGDVYINPMTITKEEAQYVLSVFKKLNKDK